MKYEIVELEARTLVGMAAEHLKNEDPKMMAAVGGVWAAFLGEGRKKLGAKETDSAYGLYTDYDFAAGDYTMLAACQSAVCPEGFRQITIPAGKYAKFAFHGNVRTATAAAWAQVWAEPLPRSNQVDFEEYCGVNEQGEGDIFIYIGLADICQSCGMPMGSDGLRGTEKDGSKSADYCCYCYQKGAFTSDCTMEEMIDFCLTMPGSDKIYSDKDAARKQMLEYFPTLARWKK